MKMRLDKNSAHLTLDTLTPGQRGKVAGVSGKNSRLCARLLAMGLVAGTAFEVVCTAPFGDAIQIKARGYDLSLRNSEATHVQVEIG